MDQQRWGLNFRDALDIFESVFDKILSKDANAISRHCSYRGKWWHEYQRAWFALRGEVQSGARADRPSEQNDVFLLVFELGNHVLIEQVGISD